MKVLFLAWRDLANPQAGGSEVLVDRLATGLHELGHDVALLCAGPVGDRPYRAIANGGRYSQYVRAPLAYMHQFRDRDLVVDVSNGMSFFAPFWRRKASLCLVNHVHTPMWSEWFPGPVAAMGRSLERDLLPFAYRHRLFIAVSQSTADDLVRIGVDPDQIRIVNNGVDRLPHHEGRRSRAPLFVSIARLVPHKRIDLLLRMWDRVRPVTGGRLVIVGAGPERARLEALAGDGVEFRGYVSEEEKHRLLSEAWLLLHPAELEGWGLVVMEAAQMGTPTLAFDVPGLRDSVANAASGVLASSSEEFIAEWIQLTSDPAYRAELSSGARWRAAQFPWSRTVSLFAKAAEEAIELARSRRPGLAVPSMSPLHPAVDALHVSGLEPVVIDLRHRSTEPPGSCDEALEESS